MAMNWLDMNRRNIPGMNDNPSNGMLANYGQPQMQQIPGQFDRSNFMPQNRTMMPINTGQTEQWGNLRDNSGMTGYIDPQQDRLRRMMGMGMGF